MAAIEAFLITSGLPARRFGELAVSDPRFVYDLRKGRSAGARLMQKTEQFIKRNEGKAVDAIEAAVERRRKRAA